MEDLTWNYHGGMYVLVPFGSAILWHAVGRVKGPSETMNTVFKVWSRILPFFLCLLSCSGTQIVHSVFISYDVNGKWIEQRNGAAFLPIIMSILRFTAVLIVIDRLHRVYDRPDYSRSTVWSILRRVCTVWILYAGCGGTINLMLPAIVFDDILSCCVDWLEEIGATEFMPALLTAFLDFAFLIPCFVKSVQLSLLFFRESHYITAIAGTICACHNGHVLYVSIFNSFLEYLTEFIDEFRGKRK